MPPFTRRQAREISQAGGEDTPVTGTGRLQSIVPQTRRIEIVLPARSRRSLVNQQSRIAPSHPPSPANASSSEPESTTSAIASSSPPSTASEIPDPPVVDRRRIEAVLMDCAAQEIDVDSWNITMSPPHYCQTFCTTLSIAKIGSHIYSQVKDDDLYANWVLIGDAGCRLLIAPEYKRRLIRAIRHKRPIHPSKTNWKLTDAPFTMSCFELMELLTVIGCRAIRIQLYGQKLRLHPRYFPQAPEEPVHYLAATNQWDIGVTYRSNKIFLFSPAQSISGMDVYPMLIPMSKDFGSINVKLIARGKECRVKIYPRLVHVLKSIRGQLQKYDPKTLSGLIKQLTAAEQLLKEVTPIDDEECGGLRIELSVSTCTLAEARTFAIESQLLDPETWLLEGGPGYVQPYKLNLKLVTKTELLTNANRLVRVAVDQRLLMGDGNRRSKEWEKRIVADVFAAVGWNSGKRRLTKSTNTEAWWITGEGDSADDPQNEEDQILMDINRVWHSGRPMKDLLRAVKRGLRNGILPCLESVMDDSHRYHSAGSGSRFRLRCVVCRHSMNEYRSRAYFAKLIRHGLLSREAVQLPSPPSLAQQDQAQAPGIANPGRPLARPRRQYVTSVSDVLRTRQPRPSDLDLSGLGIELVRPSVDQRPVSFM
ncbi:hypothetical protein C366_06658 [Cryptococcus neoformans Tu401-1]|nr:hypothetical protein C366_06658 [Cryptococcus neoformans var. grubii Tu401-1]